MTSLFSRGCRDAILACVVLVGGVCADDAEASSTGPLLLRDPTISRGNVAFSFGGYIWVVGRDGHGLRQLTHGGHDRKPRFSPDGTQIAFSAGYLDEAYGEHQSGGIYVIPTNGGVPHRLTYHPLDLAAVAWTPDGTHVIFSSRRTAFELHHQLMVQLFSIPVTGGPVEPIPLPTAAEAALSPDGTHLAYVPNVRQQPEWKRYRGGQTTRIWIVNLADSGVEAKIPRNNSNDSNPMWVGDTLYFLSDRNGPVSLFAYDLKSKQVTQVINNTGFDIKSAAAGPDAIIYDQFGSLHQLSLGSGEDRVLNVHPQADFPEVHPQVVKIDPTQIRFAGLSPAGTDAVFGAHGEIFTVSEKTGAVRDITGTSDAVERDPAWSPDGKSIAYFSDESGEYGLHIHDVSGAAALTKIGLGRPPGFYYQPTWSPDSAKVGYADQRSNYWYVDLQSKTPVRVDTDLYEEVPADLQMAWSFDSRWIAYTKRLPNRLRSIFLYSLNQAKSYQLTDGEVDASHPVFDKSGRYLYFTASTNIAQSVAQMDMTSLQHPAMQTVYLVVLRKGLASPLDKAAQDNETRETSGTAIDTDDLKQRILKLPIPAGNYYALSSGQPGVLFLVDGPQTNLLQIGTTTTRVSRFDLRTLKAQQFLDDVVASRARSMNYIPCFYVSFSGDRVLYLQRDRWVIAATGKSSHDESTVLNLDSMQMHVDPRAEWKEIYTQAWRHERDFFYDPGMHGLDLDKVERRYSPFLQNITTRLDLSYLLREMLGNLTIGHLVVLGGDGTSVKQESVGLLGADYTVDNGRYRFARIYGSDLWYDGDPWSPEVHAPLTQLGSEVSPGDYLLAVDGREVHATVDVYDFFENTAGKSITLTVGPSASGMGARQVRVIPVQDETVLRSYAWMEDNRRKVQELSGGRVAYIYLPDVSEPGYARFNRDYFAQIDKAAAVIDERFNYGGIIPDYIIQYLSRPLMSLWYLRYTKDITEPQESIFGPKVMIINEMAGSGGDALAWMFHKAGVGTLIGTRTWGGLVTNKAPDDLLDGGVVAAPGRAFFSSDGTAWEIENTGVAPDIEVEEDPKAVREGHDPQLETAVRVALERLEDRAPPSMQKHPPYLNYFKRNSAETR